MSSVAAATATVSPAAASWRVTYWVPISQGGDSWLTLTFSTAGDGQGDVEVAELLVSQFDAIVSTFRWTLE